MHVLTVDRSARSLIVVTGLWQEQNKTLSDHAQRAFLVWAIRVSLRAVIHSGSSATGTEEKALGELLVRFALRT